MHLRAAALVAGLAICAGLATPAAAATDPKPVEVARAGAVKLFASDEKAKLCIGTDLEGFDNACADEADEGVATVSAASDDQAYLGTAVPSSAASIEVRRAGALLVGGPTVAGEAYTGVRKGSVRFALVRLPAKARVDGLRVRALSATGALVAVIAADDFAELEVARTRLKSGRARDVRWTLFAETRSELTPSVLDLGHESVSRCVGVELNDLDWGSACAGGSPFESADPFDATRASAAETCNPPFRVVYGAVDGSVSSVIVVLGDGRRVTVATVPVGDGRRAYAVPGAAGAVRSVTIPGQGVVKPGFAPLSVVCAGGGQGLTLLNFGSSAFGLFSILLGLPPVTAVGPVTTIPGTPPIQVADGPADTLCIAVAGKPFDGLGCDIVSPLLSDPLGTFDDLVDTTAFALAVPARVATVRFSSADGKTARNIPTVAGAGYAGRYAGRVRFASASLSNLADLSRLQYLDAGGTVLFSESESAEAGDDSIVVPRVGRPRRVAGRAGGPTLWQTNARYGKLVDRCLSLTGGPQPGPRDNCQTSRDDATVLLAASCKTHRVSAGIAVRAGTRVFADTGRRVKPAVALRNGAAVLTLPAGRPLRSLTFIRKGRRRHVEIGAPPGARQCGWHLAPDVSDL